jgi:pseudaminic acid cytidylyltransferase
VVNTLPTPCLSTLENYASPSFSAVAIIPARGGSKRIPRKNVKLFAGLPMIAHSIKAARDSGVFDRIIVSTDDAEIIEIANAYGAETPFMRPPELANDYATTSSVLLHALDFLKTNGCEVKMFSCIYATAPFLRAIDIRRGFELLRTSGATSALTVTAYAFPVFRALKMESTGRVNFLWPEYRVTRSQDLPIAYHDAGMCYIFNTEHFIALKGQYPDGQMPIILQDAVPIILPSTMVQDIDTPEDWERAEQLLAMLSTSQGHGGRYE